RAFHTLSLLDALPIWSTSRYCLKFNVASTKARYHSVEAYQVILIRIRYCTLCRHGHGELLVSGSIYIGCAHGQRGYCQIGYGYGDRKSTRLNSSHVKI